jgi:hypothetical protein
LELGVVSLLLFGLLGLSWTELWFGFSW